MNRSPTLTENELTLSGVLKVPTNDGGRVSLAAALELSLQVVRLVAAAHDQGKVVGVLDAQHLICSKKGVQLGGRGGNPIAPELKRGEMPDRLTDVYALGALMYRLLTGRRVEQARIIEPPSHFNPAVDTALDDLVLAALDEDPSMRPHSAREIERWLLGVYDELGMEADAKTEATELIEQGAKRLKRPPPLPQPRRPRFDPDATLDADEPDLDEPGYSPRLNSNPLEKKWLIAAGAALVVLILLAVAWPTGKKKSETLRSDDVPAKVTRAPVALPQPVVQAKLASGDGLKVAESPKKSTRRARR